MASRWQTGRAVPGQDALFSVSEILGPLPGRVDPPPLDGYDVVLVNISAGKDSQATLDVTVRAADAAGDRPKIVVVFADLGADDEWPGSPGLAAEHAAHYGLRFETVRREITAPDGPRRPQGLIEHIEARGKWPDAARRYCTSDAKRAPVYRLMTALAREQHAAGVTGRPVRILNVLGLRAQESPRRALMAPFRHDERASNSVRQVDEWLPVHSWTAEQVWAQIAQAGTWPHPVYAQGMPRLSCRFCVLASRPALVRAAAPTWKPRWATSSAPICPCARSSPTPRAAPPRCPPRSG